MPVIQCLSVVERRNVCVAQLDRASGYGPEGREFESCHTQYLTLRSEEDLRVFFEMDFTMNGLGRPCPITADELWSWADRG